MRGLFSATPSAVDNLGAVRGMKGVQRPEEFVDPSLLPKGTAGRDLVTVVGHLGSAVPGEFAEASGRWVTVRRRDHCHARDTRRISDTPWGKITG